MLSFFKSSADVVYVVETDEYLSNESLERLSWLFGQAHQMLQPNYPGRYIDRKSVV